MTLLIKNVQVVTDGKEPRPAQDIFVNGGRISAIGSFPSKTADVVIDGQGVYAAPGFIDVHAEVDHSFDLFRTPGQEEFLLQGVTTIVVGHEGISLAPFLPAAAELFAPWSERHRRVNVHWRTMAEFFKALAHRGFGVNVMTLAGYDTARAVAASGRRAKATTPRDRDVYLHLLERSLEEGAGGISCRIGEKALVGDLKRLIRLAAGAGGILAAVVPPILNDADESAEAVSSALALVTSGRHRVLLGHGGFLGVPEERLRLFLAAIDALAEDHGFAFEVNPAQSVILPLVSFLPAWARAQGDAALRVHLEDPWFVKKVINEMPSVDLKRFVVASAIGAEPFAGDTLSAVKGHYGTKDAKRTLIRLMRETRLRAFVAEVHAKKDIHMALLRHPRSLVASYRTGVALPAARRGALGPYPFLRFLALAEAEGLMPLSAAIQKITKDAAAFLGLVDRGSLIEGAAADIVGFRDGKVNFAVVNGKIAMSGGVMAGTYGGRLLRRESRI